MAMNENSNCRNRQKAIKKNFQGCTLKSSPDYDSKEISKNSTENRFMSKFALFEQFEDSESLSSCDD